MRVKPKQIFSHLFNATFNHDVVFKGLGLINQKIGFIEVIYCGYPSNKKYLAEYDSKIKGQVEKYKYRPYLAGFYIQNKRLGFKFFISATEEEFSKGEGLIQLSQVEKRVREIKHFLNAKEQSFAGIVSGLLYRNGHITESSERDKVVRCVVKGIEKVRELEGYDKNVPIIILGAKGYIGSEVAKGLQNRKLYLLDINKDEKVSSDWPAELAGTKAIMVNISRKHQLKHYAPLVWKELVLLNEVYPEPNQEELALYEKKGGHVYHLSGVKGWSAPSFPGGYENAIPCSASWSSIDIDIVVKKLSSRT
jgi:hypothetical protein